MRATRRPPELKPSASCTSSQFSTGARRLAALTCCVTILAVCSLTVVFGQTIQQLPRHVPEATTRMAPLGPLPPGTPIDLVVGLPLRNAAELDALMRDIYEPSSPRFRQFLSPQEYTERFCPTVNAFQSLLQFARTNRLTIVEAPANRKFLHVRAPAEVINRVFHVSLQQYKHPTENRLFYAPNVEPSIALETPISRITGLDNFRLPRRISP